MNPPLRPDPAGPLPPCAAVSVAGRRGHNEDATLVRQALVGGVPLTLVAVADGMGGHERGEVASALAVETLDVAWPALQTALAGPLARGDVEEAAGAARAHLTAVFCEADRRIAAASGGDGMGTTLVAAVVMGSHAVVAHVGDSRAYLVRRDDVEQLTDDHSASAEAVRMGAMTAEEAQRSAYANALTRSLDGGGDGAPDLTPSGSGWLDLDAGAVLVLCSDGLSGPLTELDLFEGVVRTPDVGTACTALAASAIERGGRDNVSAVAVEPVAVARAPDLLALDPVRVSALLDPAAAERTSDPARDGLDLRPANRRRTLALAGIGVALLFVVGFALWRGGALTALLSATDPATAPVSVAPSDTTSTLTSASTRPAPVPPDSPRVGSQRRPETPGSRQPPTPRMDSASVLASPVNRPPPARSSGWSAPPPSAPPPAPPGAASTPAPGSRPVESAQPPTASPAPPDSSRFYP